MILFPFQYDELNGRELNSSPNAGHFNRNELGSYIFETKKLNEMACEQLSASVISNRFPLVLDIDKTLIFNDADDDFPKLPNKPNSFEYVIRMKL